MAKKLAALLGILRAAPHIPCSDDPILWLRDEPEWKLEAARKVDRIVSRRLYRKSKRALRSLDLVRAQFDRLARSARNTLSTVHALDRRGSLTPEQRVELINRLRTINSALWSKLVDQHGRYDKLEKLAGTETGRLRVFAERNERWGKSLIRQGKWLMAFSVTRLELDGVEVELLKMLQKGKSLVHIGRHRLNAGTNLNAAADNYAELAPQLKLLVRTYDDIHTSLVHWEEKLTRRNGKGRVR